MEPITQDPYDLDSWVKKIEDYLIGGEDEEPLDRVTGKELLAGALGISAFFLERHHFTRIASVMRQLGWEKYQYREEGKNVWGYVDPKSEWQVCLRFARQGRVPKRRPEAWKRRQAAKRATAKRSKV